MVSVMPQPMPPPCFMPLRGPCSSGSLPVAEPIAQETQDEFTFEMNLPGHEPNEIEVALENDKLTIRGRATTKPHFSSVHQLPLDNHRIDIDSATAVVEDGVLTVTLPKAAKEEPQKTRIAISATSDKADGDFSEGMVSDDAQYNLNLTAAGIAASDLSINMHDGVLTVKGESKRTKRKISEVYKLPCDASAFGATASHVDGILNITIPKAAKQGAMRIHVSRGARHLKEWARQQAAIANDAKKGSAAAEAAAEVVVEAAAEATVEAAAPVPLVDDGPKRVTSSPETTPAVTSGASSPRRRQQLPRVRPPETTPAVTPSPETTSPAATPSPERE